ncbi:MAG: hypothetical protein K8S23_02000 [Candidatus Cloacimonetes bacterium]|nr:hypothetical protein [Candidatus Cloacimonadota bacterium]
MKKSKDKIAFGVFQDGLSVKVAQLSLDNGVIKVQRLEETILTYPLYQEKISTNKTEKTEILEDDLEIPEIAEFEESDGFEDIQKEEDLSGKADLQKLLLNFLLENGKISLNANDSQISYYYFDSKFSEGKLRKKGEDVFLTKQGIGALESEILTIEEKKLKKGNTKYNYIINPDKSITSFVHRGEFELLNAIQEINLVASKKKYFFGSIDPNEVLLMNLVRNNYSFSDDEYVLLLYIGVDFKVGIVMQGKNHIKTFPIIITDSKPANMRRAIFSKVTLEEDLSHMHFTQNIILAGEYIKDEDVAYFVLKFSYRSKVSRLEFQKDMIPEETELNEIERHTEVNPERMAKFAIPIASAWRTLDPKNENFYKTNLIPYKILDRQKPFKIEWHGYLLLASLFYFSLSGTIINLQIDQDIKNTKIKIKTTERQLKEKNELARKLEEIKRELIILAEQAEKMELIKGNNNQWTYIIEVLSQAVNDNPLTWIENIMTEREEFRIKGYTTRKKNVINFSNLFPGAKIQFISKSDHDSIDYWEFDILFSYPQNIDEPVGLVKGNPYNPN